jgi:hypothetical protein
MTVNRMTTEHEGVNAMRCLRCLLRVMGVLLLLVGAGLACAAIRFQDLGAAATACGAVGAAVFAVEYALGNRAP